MGSNKHEINAIIATPGNNFCADCGCNSPRWASINLGVLICINCSGIHRKLGVHISKVKSLTLDTLKPEWIHLLKCIGNDVANYYYLNKLPDNVHKLKPGESAHKKEIWIRNKYEKKIYASLELIEPCILVAQGKNPRKMYNVSKQARSISESDSFANFSTTEGYENSSVKNLQLINLENNDVNFANFEMHTHSCPVDVNINQAQHNQPSPHEVFVNKVKDPQVPNMNDINKNRDAKIEAAKACISKLYKNPEQLGLSPKSNEIKPNCFDELGNIDFTKML